MTAVATDMKSSSPKFVGDGSPLPASGSGRGGRRNGLQQSDKLHVLHNVPFYCELTRHFLELCCKRVPVDAEGTATALLAVIKTLASWPDVLEILDDVEKTYNKYAMVDPYAPRQTNVEPPPPTPSTPSCPSSSPRSWTGTLLRFPRLVQWSQLRPRLSDIIMLNSITACLGRRRHRHLN